MIDVKNFQVTVIKESTAEYGKKEGERNIIGFFIVKKGYLLELYKTLHPEDATATGDKPDIVTIDNALI